MGFTGPVSDFLRWLGVEPEPQVNKKLEQKEKYENTAVLL